MAGWMKGVVKEVLSGDTLVVMGNVKGGPPPEKRITLSSLQAPRLGRRDGTTKDEPFAWQSREFLRKKAIGQPCIFRVDYVLENVSREFGSVFIGQSTPPENLAMSVVQAGWAAVRGGKQQSPYFEELSSASEMAQQSGIGMYAKDSDALASAVRTLPSSENGQGLDAMNMLSTMGKGKPLPAIVDQVLNGTTLRVILLPSFHTATVMVCGLQAPSMGRRNQEAPDAEPTPEPFARESKHFTECRILNREVRVCLEGVDKYNNLFGTVKFVVEEQPVDLGEQMAKLGLAKVVDWGLAMMTNGAMRLKEAERGAKQQRAGMWRDYMPPASAGQKLADEYKGKVSEVVSGDILVVKDPNGAEQRFSLASIRAPRLGRREEKPEPYAIEAKEFMRKTLIGRTVNVKMEYNRTIGGPAAGGQEANGAAANVMRFGSVTFEDVGQDGQPRTKNIAEMLVERGLAVAQSHRSDDERSVYYEAYIDAEARAKKSKKGVQGNLDKAPIHRVNDVSVGAGLKQAKQYLPFFTRGGRVPAVVEYVLGAHRYKLHIPKEGVMIAFSPSGVKAPSRAQPANPSIGKGAVAEEPYAAEAYAFARDALMQRDVEVQVDSIDKGGTFLGSLYAPSLKPQSNVGIALLAAGLAKLHPSFVPSRVPGGDLLQAAQDAAQAARLKVWEGYVEEEAPAALEEGGPEAAVANGAAPAEKVTVTEVKDGKTFYVQRAGEPRVAWLEEALSKLGLEAAKGLPPKRGEMGIAQFSLDKRWYRAYVEAVAGNTYDVLFVDFGNRESVPVERVRAMDPSVAAVPAQAQECELAYLKVPSPDTENGMDARGYMGQMLGDGRTLEMKTIFRDRPAGGKNPISSKPVLKVVLGEVPSAESGSKQPPTINEEMLAAGLARIARSRGRLPKGDPELVAALEAAEDAAKSQRLGIWQYGDPGDSDDEEDFPRPGAWGKPR
mmetsp:Transcript_36162/g.91251  ORF Transcript_36162/g.91251 Transcript_36162/m.91251 type:complete len:949 (-) Transcript_36162:968-3814(-)